MKRIAFILMTIVACSAVAVDGFALTVRAESVSSGKYEDGKYEHSQGGFEGTYIIDEAGGIVILEKIFENNREGKIGEGAIYDITNIVVSEGLSALLVSGNKKGQKIITAVREAGLGAFETLIIGKDFYEFCRAANGRFYLEYGDVSKD